MYDGFAVYKKYLALKLHFTTDKYDYHKYEGKVNSKLETFTKRNDRYFFHKLSKQYNEQEILGFFISNFLADSKKWVGNLMRNDGKDVYLAWKKYNDAFAYHFKRDCLLVYNNFNDRGLSFDDGFRVFKGQHPRFLGLLLSKKITFETAVVFEKAIRFSKQWDRDIKEKVVWPVVLNKIKKYEKFVKYNEMQTRLIMKEVFVSDN